MKKGFTLIELILVISVGLTMSFLSFKQMLLSHENNEAKVAGQQIEQIGHAVNNYITAHYTELSTLKNATGSTIDPGPRTCTASINSCSITLQSLINEGFLSSTYSDKNIFNSSYNITLKRGGISPYYMISGLILTNDSWITSGNNPRYDLLGKAMQSAGIDSGTTRDSTNVVNGYNGNWHLSNTDYSSINKRGLLAYQVGYNSHSYSSYLRRDGSLPMTGSLNMDNNDIYGAKNITASDTITGGTLHSKGNVIAHNGYGHQLTIGGDNAGNDFDIRIGPGGKGYLGVLSTDQTPVTLAANGTLLARSPTTSLTSVSLDGTTGNILATGDITSGGWVKAKNGYGDVIGLGGDAAGNDYEIKMESDSKSLAIFAPFLPATEKILRVSNTVWDKNTGSLITSGIETFSLFKSGDLTTAGNITSKKEIMAANGYGDTLAIGGNQAGNDYELRLNSNKPLAIWGPNTPDTSPLFEIASTGTNNLKNIQMFGNGNILSSGNITASTLTPTLLSTISGTCSTNGSISVDNKGNVLSCVSGRWNASNISNLSDNGGVVFPDGLKMIWGTSTPGPAYIQGIASIQWFESDGIDITPVFTKDGITHQINTIISWQSSAIDISGFGYAEKFWCRRDVINKLRCWSGANQVNLVVSGKYLIIGY